MQDKTKSKMFLFRIISVRKYEIPIAMVTNRLGDLGVIIDSICRPFSTRHRYFF